jgi:membrane-associated protease RseP (regulator of RpoE activity)
MKKQRFASIALLVALVSLVAAGALFMGQGRPDATVDYEPEPGYAGIRLQNIFRDDQVTRTVIVGAVAPGGPAEAAGFRGDGSVQDHIVAMDGNPISKDTDVFAAINSKEPGETIEATVQRHVCVEDKGCDSEPEMITLVIRLAERPSSDVGFAQRYTSVDFEDQFRIGLMLEALTRTTAERYGIGRPGGVVIANAWPFSWRDRDSPQPGDVIVRFGGDEVADPARLQQLIDDAPEDLPIAISIRRGDDVLNYTLLPLGPDVPGANWLLPEPRRRVKEALENDHLHPVRIDTSLRVNISGSVPDRQATSRIGAIKRLTDSSITIEMYTSGVEWTASISPETMWAPRELALIHERPDDLKVGDFVEIHTADGNSARFVLDLSVPLALQ